MGALARELGFRQVSLSSDVMPMVRAVPRGYTACADAYLTPCIGRYLEGFRAGFASQLQVRGGGISWKWPVQKRHLRPTWFCACKEGLSVCALLCRTVVQLKYVGEENC